MSAKSDDDNENQSNLTGANIRTSTKACLELNENDNLTAGYLTIFRRLIDEEPNLYCPTTDAFLLRFLRARKFNTERAFKMLKQYYEMRRKHKDVFEELHPVALLPIFNQGLQSILQERDQEGRQVFLFKAGAWDPTKCNLDDIFRANCLYLEEMTSSYETQVNGVAAIVDCCGLNFYHARRFTPKHAQRMISIIQDSFPARFKEFHLVNQPYIFNILFAVVKPFLNPKIRNRIHFHGPDLGSLHQFLSPDILPASLGGSGHCDDTFISKMLTKNETYKDMLKYGFKPPPSSPNLPQ